VAAIAAAAQGGLAPPPLLAPASHLERLQACMQMCVVCHVVGAEFALLTTQVAPTRPVIQHTCVCLCSS
jgi:hypothetical protein